MYYWKNIAYISAAAPGSWRTVEGLQLIGQSYAIKGGLLQLAYGGGTKPSPSHSCEAREVNLIWPILRTGIVAV